MSDLDREDLDEAEDDEPEVDPKDVRPVDRSEMLVLAQTEYGRILELLEDLDDEEWSLPTDCAEWTVHDVVAHLLGTAEANASLRENRRQIVSGRRLARRHDLRDVDGINRLQVDGRRHLSPTELHDRLARIAPNAVRGRYRTPRVLRRLRAADPTGGTTRLGFLVDVVYTRDQWMHRIDVALATGRDLEVSADHDGRIVADVVRQWARIHDEAIDLRLTGPAGGRYRRGADPESFQLDAVEFCRALAGRTSLPEGLPDVPVPF